MSSNIDMGRAVGERFDCQERTSPSSLGDVLTIDSKEDTGRGFFVEKD